MEKKLDSGLRIADGETAQEPTAIRCTRFCVSARPIR
jgi:hypothetical protein